MNRFFRQILFVAPVGLALLSSTAHAQVVSGKPFPNTYNMVNPNPYVAQGMKLNQWIYNTTAVGKTYSQFPPWMYGYNPYPSVANYGPVYQPTYRPPVYQPPYANPYPNPSGGYVPGGDPYSSGYTPGGYSPYDPYSSYVDPNGGYLRGQADTMRAYGQLTIDFEQARLAREMVNQAKLDTKKKSIELQNWIRENTLTFTQEQERIAAMTLRRIQSAATQSEIWNGKAQNLLLDSLVKNAKKSAALPVPIDEDVLKQINVTGSYGNLGLLRNNGRFTWPAPLRDLSPDREYADLLNTIALETHQAFRQAVDAKLDGNLVRDLRSRTNRLRDQLAAKVNEIPLAQNLEAKRFLNDFDDALLALERGDALVYFDFQKALAGTGKTAQDLVDFMGRRGLHFAPAVAGDESAYQALYSALAAYDIALGGGQVASGKSN